MKRLAFKLFNSRHADTWIYVEWWFEPRDIWVGVYWTWEHMRTVFAIYVTVIPCFPVKLGMSRVKWYIKPEKVKRPYSFWTQG